MKSVKYLVLVALFIVLASTAQGQSCQACSYYDGNCYSAPTGVIGNTACTPNWPPGSGCTYWGQDCSNSQVGPPTQENYCIFVNPGDPACDRRVTPYQVVCVPSIENRILRSQRVPGRTIQLIRATNGQLIVFEHSL
jgi:hypothetical protein